MSEEAELQARIAALSGRINQQKQSGSAVPPNTYRGGYSGGYHAPPSRWTPYAQPHASQMYTPPPYARGGGYKKPSFRNKTLVVNSSTADPLSAADTPTDSPGWVSKRDRGNMQLINTSVYEQKMQQKQLEMQESAKEKQRLRNEREKIKVIGLVQGSGGSSVASEGQVNTPKDIIINDLHFRVAVDGSKLIRIFGEDTGLRNSCIDGFLNKTDGSNKDAQTTPKQAKVAGVTFHRSKNGNLYRAGVVKKSISKPKPNRSAKLCQKFTYTGTQDSLQNQASPHTTGLHENKPLLNSVGRPLRHLLTLVTGLCPAGDRCRFTHDINKTAICQQFLRHGNCAAGDECNLSHDLTPTRVPICIHFVRGNCTNEECRYVHIRPNSTAPVCRAFGTLGYCEKGADCEDRHVMECPDYSNTGACRDTNCRLPHVDSVANKRRAEATKSTGRQGSPTSHDSSDLSSDEEQYQEIDSDDVDSDAMGEDDDVIMAGSGDQGRDVSQQQDFISFS